MRKLVKWGGIGTAVVLVAFIAIGWIGDVSSGWWGAVGQWFGAIGSIIAAGIALYIADLGRREAEKQRKDDEKIQARLIFGEFQPRHGLIGDVQIVNRSGGFILDPTIVNLSIPRSEREWIITDPEGQYLVVPPFRIADEARAHSRTDQVTFVPAGEEPDEAETIKQLVVTIRFFDADGRGWTRRGRAEPERWFPEDDLIEWLPPDDEPPA